MDEVKQDFEWFVGQHREMWSWLARHLSKTKMDYLREHTELDEDSLVADCFPCEYAETRLTEDVDCDVCIFDWVPNTRCLERYSPYWYYSEYWDSSDCGDVIAKSSAAKKICELPLSYDWIVAIYGKEQKLPNSFKSVLREHIEKEAKRLCNEIDIHMLNEILEEKEDEMKKVKREFVCDENGKKYRTIENIVLESDDVCCREAKKLIVEEYGRRYGLDSEIPANEAHSVERKFVDSGWMERNKYRVPSRTRYIKTGRVLNGLNYPVYIGKIPESNEAAMYNYDFAPIGRVEAHYINGDYWVKADDIAPIIKREFPYKFKSVDSIEFSENSENTLDIYEEER